jgi:hypothetical protein
VRSGAPQVIGQSTGMAAPGVFPRRGAVAPASSCVTVREPIYPRRLATHSIPPLRRGGYTGSVAESVTETERSSQPETGTVRAGGDSFAYVIADFAFPTEGQAIPTTSPITAVLYSRDGIPLAVLYPAR